MTNADLDVHFWRRLGRGFAFARRIPPRQILRRSYLVSKRRFLDRLGPRPLPGAEGCVISPTPPQSIFCARKGLAERGVSGWRFVFLNDARLIPTPSPPRGAGLRPRDRLWLMNLHYMEFLEGLSDAAFIEAIEAWLAANPTVEPRGWFDVWNAYAVSIRVVVWMQQIVTRASLPETLRARMIESVARQVAFLERNLETDIGGNHLIKNIKALLWASAFFDGPAAGRWRKRGAVLLTRALRDQILADGLHDERSLSYHAQVFADLLECRVALGADSLTEGLDQTLEAMSRPLVELTHLDGGPPLFNDSGLRMAYSPRECLEAFARMGGTSVPPREVASYPIGGYFAARRGSDVFVADCGPISPEALPAHGHGDVLAFEWSVGGRRIIVDQGVFEYVAGERRSLSRSCASHNTVALAGADQADFFGDFRAGARARATVRHFEDRGAGFLLVGSHDGFARLPGRPVHVRSFDVSPDCVVIHDRFEGNHAGMATASLLLHPDVVVEAHGDRFVLNGPTAKIAITATTTPSVIPAVWWPDMGVEMATRRLIFTFPANGAGLRVQMAIEAPCGAE